MSLLSYFDLVGLIEQGVVTASLDNVNASSIDITLGGTIMVEKRGRNNIVDLANRESVGMELLELDDRGYLINPDEFILASSCETFNLPDNISAEYKLKSSMARNGLEHLNAGWADAGWSNSKLTLELKNMTQTHRLRIRPGMKIGQMVFFKHAPVPDHASYAVKGRYNNQASVTASKGVL